MTANHSLLGGVEIERPSRIIMEVRRPKTAQESVLAEIRRAISTGRLAPGSPIRQDSLATELGVSRVPVREALRILEGEGQVTYEPYKGYAVAVLDKKEVTELYFIRHVLEAEALRAGVPNLTEAAIARLETLVEDMEVIDGEDVDALAELNDAFHFALFEASGMPRLVHLIRLLWDASNAYRSLYLMNQAYHQTTHDEHRAILEAARRRDVGALVAAQEHHRKSVLAFVRETLQPDVGSTLRTGLSST